MPKQIAVITPGDSNEPTVYQAYFSDWSDELQCCLGQRYSGSNARKVHTQVTTPGAAMLEPGARSFAEISDLMTGVPSKAK